MRLAEAETQLPDDAQSDPQVVVLASIDPRSQHQCIAQKGRSGLMQQGRKSSGGQDLQDCAAEEQATKRGRKRARKASQKAYIF
jgi:hypothetical protein